MLIDVLELIRSEEAISPRAPFAGIRGASRSSYPHQIEERQQSLSVRHRRRS